MITADNLKGCKGTFAAHFNYGPAGGASMYRSIDYPRFSWLVRVYRGKMAHKLGKRGDTFFHVDGKQVATLEDAAAALNVPADMSLEEHALLQWLPRDWVTPAAMREAVGGDRILDAQNILDPLKEKGFLQIKYLPEPDPERAKIKPLAPFWRVTPDCVK